MTNLKTLVVSRCSLQRLPNMQALDKITNLTLDNNTTIYIDSLLEKRIGIVFK
jgi:Leucine-rich repeat (LRR) protein